MKKLSLFILTLLLSATCAWAADWATTYTEAYADAPKAGIQGEERTYTSSVFPHITWNYCKVRIKGDTLPAGKQAIWLNRNVTNYDDANPSYFECAHIEGGVKKLEFKYKQANSGDDNKILCLAIKANDVRIDSIRFTGASEYRNKARSYSKNNLGIKSNTKFTLQNISHNADADYTIIPGRLTLSALTITPYLLYRNKDITIGTKQRGYVNRELLDNTGSSETITYLSSNTSIATVDAETGVVTPVSAGNVTISASLDGGITTITDYTLHVVDGIVAENFSKVVQTGSAPENTPWAGDLFSWKVMSVRRFTNDTIYDYPRVQGTWMAENGGYVQTEQAVEGGIKHIQFDWMQWTDVSSTTIKVSYDGVDKVTDAQTGHAQFDHFTIDEDIDCASEGVLKIYNASPSSPANRITIGAVKITPYLLYTTKSHTIDTRVDALTYTNNDLINNTSGTDVQYSILPTGSGATIDAGTGEVTVTDATEGDFTVTAEWGDVSTFYTLTVTSRAATTANYAEPTKREGLGTIAINNTLTYIEGYDGSITYSSSNTAVATVASNGTVSLAGGVGQTTITATLPQTANYKATTAYYTLYVRDNGARKESFKGLNQSGVVGTDLKDLNAGDLFTWQAQYQVRRGTNDTIWDTSHKGLSIGVSTDPSAPSILQSKAAIEGGIKHLSFYWKQWANNPDKTLRMSIYAGSTCKAYDEHASTATPTFEKYLLGANDVMRSNQQLVIKNESYTGTDFEHGTLATDNARIIIDTIYITPYLLYRTKEAEIDMRFSTTFTNNDLINNTESGDVHYSLENNDDEATIDEETGEVTALKAGEVTVKAEWSEGAFTTYTLTIVALTETEASFASSEQFMVLGNDAPANALTTNYVGTIAYASSNTDVADFEGGVLTIKGVGQTKITATMPENENYTAASASYILNVTYANIEKFSSHATTSTFAKPKETATGDLGHTWTCLLSGINTNSYFPANVIMMRAPRTNETQKSYVESSAISGGISSLAFNYSKMYAESDIALWDIHIYVNDQLVGRMTSNTGDVLEGTGGRTLNPMPTFVINDINEPGNCVIRFENHSTISGTYTEGNKARIAIDNISWEGYAAPIVLNDAENNSAILSRNSGSVLDVNTNRTLVADVWNTLCLPFAISKSTDLGGADVQEMTSAVLSGDELEIVFTALAGDELVAGTPYLVKPTSAVSLTGFTGKTIEATPSSVTDGIVTLQGIFSPTTLYKNDNSTLFVGEPDGEGNNLFYPGVTGDLNGFRAYFKIGSGESPAPALRRARFVVNAHTTPTDAEEITNQKSQITDKVIIDGQLIIIRDGVKYNAMGQQIQ